MKTTKLVLCSLLVAPLTLAAPDPQPQGKTFGEGAGLPKYLRHYDVKGGPNGTGDGQLDQEECQAMEQARKQIRKQLQQDFDTDGDGQLCKAEQDKARERLRAMIDEQRVLRFNEANTDGVEGLTIDEFSTLPGMVNKEDDLVLAIFDRLNADGDEVITESEFLAAVRQCDRDRDGSGDGKSRGGSGDGSGDGSGCGSGGGS